MRKIPNIRYRILRLLVSQALIDLRGLVELGVTDQGLIHLSVGDLKILSRLSVHLNSRAAQQDPCIRIACFNHINAPAFIAFNNMSSACIVFQHNKFASRLIFKIRMRLSGFFTIGHISVHDKIRLGQFEVARKSGLHLCLWNNNLGSAILILLGRYVSAQPQASHHGLSKLIVSADAVIFALGIKKLNRPVAVMHERDRLRTVGCRENNIAFNPGSIQCLNFRSNRCGLRYRCAFIHIDGQLNDPDGFLHMLRRNRDFSILNFNFLSRNNLHLRNVLWLRLVHIRNQIHIRDLAFNNAFSCRRIRKDLASHGAKLVFNGSCLSAHGINHRFACNIDFLLK